MWFHKQSSLVLVLRLPQHVNQAGLKGMTLLFYLRFCWECRLSHHACKYNSWRMSLHSPKLPDSWSFAPDSSQLPTLTGSQKFWHLAGSSLFGTLRARKSCGFWPCPQLCHLSLKVIPPLTQLSVWSGFLRLLSAWRLLGLQRPLHLGPPRQHWWSLVNLILSKTSSWSWIPLQSHEAKDVATAVSDLSALYLCARCTLMRNDAPPI